MSTQRVIQLLVSYGIITLFAFASEKSRVLAAVIAVFPINIMIGIWFVYTNTHGDTVLLADFLRMVLLGLVPAILFVATCWFGLRRGWSLGQALLLGNAVWFVGMAIYRAVEWRLGMQHS